MNEFYNLNIWFVIYLNNLNSYLRAFILIKSHILRYICTIYICIYIYLQYSTFIASLIPTYFNIYICICKNYIILFIFKT